LSRRYKENLAKVQSSYLQGVERGSPNTKVKFWGLELGLDLELGLGLELGLSKIRVRRRLKLKLDLKLGLILELLFKLSMSIP
jgi:hypothetical protein